MADGNSVHLHGPGRKHAASLISAGKVDQSGGWDLSTDERNALDNDMFLGEDSSLPEKDKGHWKYPFGKNGKVFRSALRAIASRASAQNESEISNAASALIDEIDKQHSRDPSQYYAEQPTGTLQGVEVFATGDWSGSRKVVADGAMLDRIVSNFHTLKQADTSTSGYGVAAKLGHASMPGDPAMGWMSALERVDNKLVADFSDVPPEIVDAIGKRRYNSVSIELYPQIKAGGKTYKDVLGGVAFLGSEWPAVKGLKALSASKFSEAGEAVILTQEQDVPNETLKFSQDQADALVTAAVTKATADMAAANAKLTTDLAAATLRADTAEAAVKSFATEAETKAFAAVIEQAEKDGRILPKDRPMIEAVAATFRAKQGKTKVGDKEFSSLDLFTAHVASMPKAVKFGERGAGSNQDRPGSGKKASDELAERASLAQAKAGGPSKLSYEDAVNAELAQDAELKARYAAGE